MNTSTTSISRRPTPGIWSVFRRYYSRDLLLARRSSGQWLNPLIFFLIVVTLFPLGIGPGPKTLAVIAPGILWVSALLAMMLSLEALFSQDFRDGTLEQMVISGQPLSIIVIAKVLAHWTLSGLPLVLLAPLLALMMQLPVEAFPVLLLSLLLGTVCLSFIGAIGAALTVSVNQSGVLLSLIVLPLCVPVLIFGSSAVAAAGMNLSSSAQLGILAAAACLCLSLAPWAIAGALRIGVTVEQ